MSIKCIRESNTEHVSVTSCSCGNDLLCQELLIKPIFLILGQFADPSDLFQFVVETFDGGKRFHCGLCNKFAHSGKTHVRNHVESVHYPNSFLYPCDQCDKSFPSKQNFQLHRSRVHKHKNTPV